MSLSNGAPRAFRLHTARATTVSAVDSTRVVLSRTRSDSIRSPAVNPPQSFAPHALHQFGRVPPHSKGRTSSRKETVWKGVLDVDALLQLQTSLGPTRWLCRQAYRRGEPYILGTMSYDSKVVKSAYQNRVISNTPNLGSHVRFRVLITAKSVLLHNRFRSSQTVLSIRLRYFDIDIETSIQ